MIQSEKISHVTHDRSPSLSDYRHSAATKGSLEDECLVDFDEKCAEYAEKKAQLQEAMAKHIEPTSLSRAKELIEEMQAIKLSVGQQAPNTVSLAQESAIAESLRAAQAAEQEYGHNSPEAKVAWTALEEVASSGVANALGGRLDEECLVDTARDACIALEELNRVLNLQNTKNGGLNS